MQVTAINSAGEGPYVAQSIHLGSKPSAPLYPELVSVTPQASLVFAWQAPLDDGCLPILNYVVSKNGVDVTTSIIPSLSRFADDISTGGAVGT